MKLVKKCLFIILLINMVVSLFGCSTSQTDAFKVAKVSELNGHNIGTITGSVTDKISQEVLPLSSLNYYTNAGDIAIALLEHKIDAFIADGGIATSIIRENDSLTYINESVAQIQYGAIFSKDEKGKAKRNDFDAFLKEINASGDLTYLRNKWLISDSPSIVPYEDLPDINGTFYIASDSMTYPFVYMYENSLAGYEIELVYLYCKSRGYKLDITVTDFGGTLLNVASGKVDAAFSGVIYSEERAENYYFSDLYATDDLYCVIRKENATSKYNNLDDLKGKTLGVVSGGIVDKYAKATLKDINIVYYNSTSDMVEALSEGKIDSIGLSDSTLSTELKNRVDIKVIGNVGYEECGYMFPKNVEGELLRRQLNDFIAQSKENGLLDELDKKWHSNNEVLKDIDYSLLTGVNGVLDYAVSSAVGEPAAYYKEDHIVGYDIDFIYEFAKANGYGLNVVDYSFVGMLQTVAAEKCDIAGSNVTITAERKQSALFSDPLYSAELVVCAYDDTVIGKDTSLLDKIISSFNRTFIKEERYSLFFNGILVTLKISFWTIIFGLLLGIAIFAIRLFDNKYINFVFDKLSNFNGEIPTVVLLMIFYYIIFNDTKIDSSWISIAAFSIYFAFVVDKLLANCLISIDVGQFEAAYAIGYNKFYTYLRVIIPQIIPMFVSLLIGDVVSLIKGTSIVGYIAVQDITKVSDIIRSRTYEAFFPLIVVTVIYILIIKVFARAITFFGKLFDYTKRDEKRILKGVKTHD